jgi:predicted transcriptional regulator
MHPNWTLISTHGLVLFHIAANGDSTMREIADQLDITERRVAQIIKDLQDAGMLCTARHGRRNSYVVNLDCGFQSPPFEGTRIAEFVELIGAHTETSVA